jgi:CubicO group peptidase (beta-lactamase class C family)
MVKLGRLFLEGGVWGGTRIVSQEWIDQATQIQIMSYPDNPTYQQYGYYWWVGTANGHPAYIAKGYGGQLIFVFPELDMVVSTTTDWTGTREQASERYSFAYSLVRDGIVGAIVE